MATIAPPPKPISPALLDSEQYIDSQIRRTRLALKVVDLAAGIITLAIGLLAFTLVAAVLDHWVFPGGLNGTGRAVLFGALMMGLAWYGWRQFVPLLRPINPVYAAHTIERTTPSLKNSLLNLLLFRTRRQQMSARVYHALEQQAAQRLSTATLDGAVDRSALLRLGYALLLIIAVCAIYSVLSPKNLAVSAARVLAPWSDLAAPSRVQILDVKPGDASVAKGERVAVSAEVHGLNAEEPVRLRYSTADEQLVDESISMQPPTPEARRFEAQLPRGAADAAAAGVQQDLLYWIEAGDARSRKFKLTVFFRPTIVVQKVRYEFPAYTGFPSKEVGDTGDIRGLEGTQVTISALANKPIKSAYVDFDADGRNDLRMNVEGDRATATFQLALGDDRRTPRHKSYMLRFTSAEGRTNFDPPTYRIDVTPDYAPEIRITKPEEPEQTARVDEIVQIGVEARDPDFAVSRVSLVGKVRDGEERTLAEMLSKNHEGRFGGIEMFTPGDAQLKPGDVLEFWAEARDNRRPEANVAFSEHRRLKIVGPADRPPPNAQQQQQPGGQQQPQQGDPQDGQQGQGGPQQQDGQAGEQGAEGEGQQGPGGAAGAQGQQNQTAQSQDGEGGKGQAGQSSSNNAEQQPSEDGAAGTSTGNSPQSQQQSPDGAANGGANAGQPAQDPTQQNPANSNPGAAADGSQQGQPQDAQPSKASAEGDDDGEVFQRISEHLNQQGGGEQQPGGAQQSTDTNAAEQQAPSQEPQGAGEQQPTEAASRTQGQQGQAGEAQPNAQQEGADPAEPKTNPSDQADEAGQPGADQSPPDKSTDAAGQSKNQSQHKAPAEGAQPQSPRENATAADQQTSPAGQSPSERQGADVPRETKTGDGNPNDAKGAQRPSPDSAMNRNDGDAGAGGATGKEQGSPGDESSAKRARDKTDDDNRTRRNDQEPPGGSPDKRESDSRGGKSGEQSGGGQEGGGQHADAAGKGEPGQNEAADEGGGRADERGRGETGTKAGTDQSAEGKTGQSSGDQPGQGSEQGAAKGHEQTQPAGGQPSNDAPPEAGKPGGEQTGEPNADGQRSPDESPAGQPGGEPSGAQGASAAPNQANAKQSPEPPSGDQKPSSQPGEQGAAGTAQPQGGGSGSASAASSQQTAEEEAADAANLEFARQQTDLVLERLDQQLAKKEVDADLLKRLGWSEAELRKFVSRWKNLKDRAAGKGDDANAANQELDAALRSLGLRRQNTIGFRAASKADEIRDLNEAYRARAPIEYADRVRRYVKDVAEGEEN